MSVASTVNFEHISCFILTVNIAEFKQINAGWVCKHIVSDKNFISVTVRNILSYGLEKLVGLLFSSLFTQSQDPK